MKKFEIIREIFEIVLRVGSDDNKQDAISEYTRDKFKNTVYVKKVLTPDVENIDSVAIISMESNFSDACDSDIRVAYYSNICKRIIVYANELPTSILLDILEYLRKQFVQNEDVNAFMKAMARIDQMNEVGMGTDLTTSYMKHILQKYYDTFVSPIINK